MVIGGDHASSAGVVRALSSSFGKIDLLLFDAHSDEYTQGGEELHCGNWVRKEMNCFNRVTRYGCREDEFLRKKYATNTRVHISVDLDVLDAKEYGFSANFPEHNGVTLDELCETIRRFTHNIQHPITADLCEYNPTLDTTGAGVFCANKILECLLEVVGK